MSVTNSQSRYAPAKLGLLLLRASHVVDAAFFASLTASAVLRGSACPPVRWVKGVLRRRRYCRPALLVPGLSPLP